MPAIKTVDEYIAGLTVWSDEVSRLRDIVSRCDLEETIKWSMPCYCLGKINVVGLGAFKGYFGLWFHHGSFLSDPNGLLINAQEGKTRGMRQWRFRSASDIKVRLIKSYVTQAIELAKRGKVTGKITPAGKISPTDIPKELADALSNKSLAKSFDTLTPGRKREYIEYVNEAKREETRLKRVAKITPMIRDGIGLNDKYR